MRDSLGQFLLLLILAGGISDSLLGQLSPCSGNEIFEVSQSLELSATLALGDLDDDGDLDIVSGFTAETSVLLNDGQGNFNQYAVIGAPDYTTSLALGDLDGDDDLDIFQANSIGNPDRIYFNDGNANFSDSGQALGNSDNHGVTLGDMDGDGDLDLIAGNLGLNIKYKASEKEPFMRKNAINKRGDDTTRLFLRFVGSLE